MDENAVWGASEEQLRKLGLIRQGDIISIKSFVMPSFLKTENSELVKNVKNAGMERISGRSTLNHRKKTKKVFIGWKHYESDNRRYRAVRATNGGGSRVSGFDCKASKLEIVDVAKTFFFPDGKSPRGFAKHMNFDLGSFNDQMIPGNFVLGNYIESLGLSKVRLYLLSKRKSFQSIIDGNDSDIDDFIQPNMNSVIFVIILGNERF